LVKLNKSQQWQKAKYNNVYNELYISINHHKNVEPAAHNGLVASSSLAGPTILSMTYYFQKYPLRFRGYAGVTVQMHLNSS